MVFQLEGIDGSLADPLALSRQKQTNLLWLGDDLVPIGDKHTSQKGMAVIARRLERRFLILYV